jgi:hypothetical protein
LRLSRSRRLRDADLFSRYDRIRRIDDDGLIPGESGNDLDLGAEIMAQRNRPEFDVLPVGDGSNAKPFRSEE